jgi:hypothetical protein
VSPTTSAISLNSGNVVMYATSDTAVGVYTVTITEKLDIRDYPFTATMQVTILTQCYLTNIIPVTPSTVYYDINEFVTRVADNSMWT